MKFAPYATPVEVLPAKLSGLARILRLSGEPNVRAVLCAETDQFVECRWPSCVVLGMLKRQR
jgi:hypothetical protein